MNPFHIGRRRVLAMLVAGAALVLPGCGVAGESLPDYRYRLTVEVDTPEGLKTGSSVIEVSTAVAGRNSIPTPGAVSHRVRGEAVTVDLGARGLLFALLRSDDNSDWASGVMYGFAPEVRQIRDADGKYDSSATFQARFMAMLKQRQPFELRGRLPGSRYMEGGLARPMLVRFGDIADPTTVVRVDPDELASAYGPDVKLKRITIQLTHDPVTVGIEKRLRWLGEYPEPSLKPTHAKTDFSLPATLHHGDFRQGAEQ